MLVLNWVVAIILNILILFIVIVLLSSLLNTIVEQVDHGKSIAYDLAYLKLIIFCLDHEDFLYIGLLTLIIIDYFDRAAVDFGIMLEGTHRSPEGTYSRGSS